MDMEAGRHATCDRKPHNAPSTTTFVWSSTRLLTCPKLYVRYELRHEIPFGESSIVSYSLHISFE